MGGQALFSCLAGNGFQNEGSMIMKKKNKKSIKNKKSAQLERINGRRSGKFGAYSVGFKKKMDI